MCRRFLALAFICVLTPSTAAPQNWSFDARQIALGAAGGGSDIGSQMMAEDKGYRSIVLPFGLFQVLRNPNVFNPESDDFDLVKAIEYAAAPLHYQFGRDAEAASGRMLSVDIANARLSRDLNAYRGFELRNQPASEGLSSPTWGMTMPVPGTPHGVYVGAGPYLAMRNESSIDQRMIDILASHVDVYLPNTSFLIGNRTTAQLAASFVGGYRGRYPVGSSEDDAVFAGVNYRYIRGFRMEDGDVAVRLDTDRGGLLTINPLAPFPLRLTRDRATSGHGFAIDVGLGARVGGFDGSFAINGIANRIDWSGVERRAYTLGNLLIGNDALVRSPAVALGDRRIELPVDYRAHAGYRSDRWYGLFEFAHGFQDTSFRTGLEYRAGAVELRGGAMYVREDWNPTGGIGFNLSRRVGLDLALYGTTANAARERRTALAVSLRFMREPAQP